MKGRPVTYSADELAWLERHCTKPFREYHRAFCRKFGRSDVSAGNLNALRKRKGWKTGRTGRFEKGQSSHNKGKRCPEGKGGRHPNARKTQFKKGHFPHNTKYFGHERLSKDGYVEISVNERNPYTGCERRYVLKHRWLWEQEHGPVPKGMALKCLGDRTNCDPANWELVPRAMLPRLNGRYGRGYDETPEELKPTIMAVARLEHALRQRRKTQESDHKREPRQCQVCAFPIRQRRASRRLLALQQRARSKTEAAGGR